MLQEDRADHRLHGVGEYRRFVPAPGGFLTTAQVNDST